MAAVPLRERGGEPFIVVGTVKDMTLHPRTLTCGYLHVYQFAEGNTQLNLVHKTQVEDVPAAIAPFGGRVLVGVAIFTVWQAVVTAIGLAIVGQIAKGKAIGGVLALVAIAIVVGAALGGLGPVTTQP